MGGAAAGATTRVDAPTRLRSTREVRAVFASRAAVASGLAVVHVRSRGDDGPPRVTVVAGKAVGQAVVRNRVKRRLRGALRDVGLRPGADYVVVGRRAALTAPAAAITDSLSRQVAAVGRG